MKLYEVPQEMLELEQALIESEGELSPELEARFDAFVQGSKEKIEAAACVIRTLELEAEAAKSEATRLSNLASARSNNADRLKSLVLKAVDAAFEGKVKTNLFTIWGQTSAENVLVDIVAGTELSDLAKTSPSFVRVKYELAKDAIKAAVKAGQELPLTIAATKVPGTRFLRIK